jgi:hypothetical protein
MMSLPYEIEKHILEFIPDCYCKFCNKKLSKINNNFCNKLCLIRLNDCIWGDYMYIRNSIMIITVSYSPLVLSPSVSDNEYITEKKYIWYCGIISFILLTLYTEQYFFYRTFLVFQYK